MIQPTTSWRTGLAGAWKSWICRPRSERAGGFTLLEVIIAFTILALALGTLLQAFTTGLRSLNAAEAYAMAVMHAKSKLEEVGRIVPVEEGAEAGEFEDGYRWVVAISPFEAPEDADWDQLDMAPFNVTVTVAWDETREVTLNTLRLGPKP
jgi:general secretion pathway protein I